MEDRGRSCYDEAGQAWRMEAEADGRLLEVVEVVLEVEEEVVKVVLAGGPRWRTGWTTGEDPQRTV